MIRNFILILILTSLASCTAPPNPQLNPFTTDGCSRFPDGTRYNKTLWLHCCTAHDIAYWQGGTREERRAADYALRECVIATGEKTIEPRRESRRPFSLSQAARADSAS